MREEVYARYQNDGFTEAEIELIWRETLEMTAMMTGRKHYVLDINKKTVDWLKGTDDLYAMRQRIAKEVDYCLGGNR